MSDIQIILNTHVDRQKIIDALTTDSSYVVEVVDNYLTNSTLVLDLNDLDATNKEAFYKTLDNATNLIEADALIWKIIVTAKEFDLSGSYVRDAVSTDGTLTLLTLGTPLKVKFEIPGFETVNYREIDLWYDDDFNPTDLTALAEIGISLFGNGGKFTVTNAVDCKVSFKKPDLATEVYVIDYEFGTQIVPA